MQQDIPITMSKKDFEDLIMSAVNSAIDKKVSSVKDELLTIEEACQYMKCSSVFLWQLRKDGKIKAVNAGKKVLFPKTEIDNYLGLDDKNISSSRELFDLFKISRITLLQWEIDKKIKPYLVGEVIKYKVSEVYAALQESRKEVKP